MSDHLQVLLDAFGWSCGLSLILQLTLFVDEFIGSVLCTERFFSGIPVSPSYQKPKVDLICFDLVWFVISSSIRATVPG